MLQRLSDAMMEAAKNARGNKVVAVAAVIGVTLIGLVSLLSEGGTEE